MNKPLHIKLRPRDEVKCVELLGREVAGISTFLVVTKLGYFYEFRTGQGSERITEIWTDQNAD